MWSIEQTQTCTNFIEIYFLPYLRHDCDILKLAGVDYHHPHTPLGPFSNSFLRKKELKNVKEINMLPYLPYLPYLQPYL